VRVSRRDLILAGLGLGVAVAAGPRVGHAWRTIPGTLGVTPLGGAIDQTAMLQSAIDAAAKSRIPLFLPPGIYSTRRLALRSGTHLTGVPGRSILRRRDGGGLIGVDHAEEIRVDGLVLDGDGRDMGFDGAALFAAATVERLQVSNCSFLRSGSAAILISCSGNVVVASNIVDKAATGIALIDGSRSAKPAIVKGNLVRNLFFRKVALSHGNGIAIDADAVVEGNTVENAPGFGILVGSDARDVSVTNNLIRDAHIGIGIPRDIAETAPIAGNRISSVKDGAIRVMNGPTPIGPDLGAPGIG
jgi:putative cofactor-binding repeat protein